MNPPAPPQSVSSQPVIVTPDSQNPQVPYTPPPRRFSKKMMGIVALVVMALAIPVTLFVLRQQQTITQQAATPEIDPNAIASVAGKNIYQADIDAMITETYENTNVSADVKASSLEKVIERRILDSEATKLGVVVSDADIDKEAQSISAPEYFDEETKYSLLREKVLLADTAYREAYIIGYWLPPTDDPRPAAKTSLVAQQRTQGKAALAEAAEQLTSGENQKEVALAIYTKYPSLQGILSFNGYRITNNPSNEELFTTPKVVMESAKDHDVYSKTLYTMNEGEVRVVPADKDAGAEVIKLVRINEANFQSYDLWLLDKKSKLVKIYKQL